MNINSLLNKTIDFTTKRVAELIGLLLVFLSILLLISLISYSPEDPNFIFPENTEIKNILGFRGSFISDLFFRIPIWKGVSIEGFLFPYALKLLSI